ncbi:antitermination protein [Aeromonas veronii]|uniref:antitermination protein Q n=1 Tax=Aeromonas veronii TaxID=654 RepID=UPI003D1BBAFF
MVLKALATLAVQHFCRTVDIPGAACHLQCCRGRGGIRGLELSRLHCKAIDKTCPRCNGTGLRPIPGTQVCRAIGPLLGTLTRGEWEQQWYRSIRRCWHGAMCRRANRKPSTSE